MGAGISRNRVLVGDGVARVASTVSEAAMDFVGLIIGVVGADESVNIGGAHCCGPDNGH